MEGSAKGPVQAIAEEPADALAEASAEALVEAPGPLGGDGEGTLTGPQAHYSECKIQSQYTSIVLCECTFCFRF